MNFLKQRFGAVTVAGISFVLMAVVLGLFLPSTAQADEDDAKAILKAMSDYMSSQKKFSFSYDAILEIVTQDNQKLGIASSGTMNIARPDKFQFTRTGGFADVLLNFDGKTLTLLGKNTNNYTEIDIPGTVDHLIDELQNSHGRALPAADLVMVDPYDQLMDGVLDIKDLGSGVIGGIECDYFAFRTEEVDWEIWIAQGDHPYPCRYAIHSKLIDGNPSYSIQISDFKTGGKAENNNFKFKNSTKAKKVDQKDRSEIDSLPDNFKMGGSK